MPLRTRMGFRRDCAAAWPKAEFVVIADYTDMQRWLDRCATSDAPAVIAIASLSQTKDYGNEWLPAAIEKSRSCQVPDLSPEAQARGEPRLVDGTLVLSRFFMSLDAHTLWCDISIDRMEAPSTLARYNGRIYMNRYCGRARNVMSERVTKAPAHSLIETTSGTRLEPLQIRIQEAARLLGYDERTIRRLIARGELRAIGRGRLRRIALADLRDWQDRNRH